MDFIDINDKERQHHRVTCYKSNANEFDVT